MFPALFQVYAWPADAVGNQMFIIAMLNDGWRPGPQRVDKKRHAFSYRLSGIAIRGLELAWDFSKRRPGRVL